MAQMQTFHLILLYTCGEELKITGNKLNLILKDLQNVSLFLSKNKFIKSILQNLLNYMMIQKSLSKRGNLVWLQRELLKV
jgi:hypothetical protein